LPTGAKYLNVYGINERNRERWGRPHQKRRQQIYREITTLRCTKSIWPYIIKEKVDMLKSLTGVFSV